MNISPSSVCEYEQTIFREKAKRSILQEGRYPLDMAKSLLNEFRVDNDHLFDNMQLRNTLRALEKTDSLRGSRMRRHKIGSIKLNSLDEEGVFAILDYYRQLGRIRNYTDEEVRTSLTKRKEEYFNQLSFGSL